MTQYDIEEILPHRDRMKLLDEVLFVDGSRAGTSATVQNNWPLVTGGHVDPLIAVELTAQTGGIIIGVEAMKENTDKKGGKGWIVGIKEARFLTQSIAVNTKLTCRASRTYEQEFYSLVRGEVFHGDNLIADVTLQIMRADSSFPE